MPHNRGTEVANRILNTLLGYYENKQQRIHAGDVAADKLITCQMPKASYLSDELEELKRRLSEAESSGGIRIDSGKHEQSHVIKRVVLLDADKLYRFVGRRKPEEVADEARDAIAPYVKGLAPEIEDVFEKTIESWRASKRYIRNLEPDQHLIAGRAFRAADALLTGSFDGTDLKTFSKRFADTSKFIDENAGKVADILRKVRKIDPGLTALDIIQSFGIRSAPHPCLIAGPITLEDQRIPTRPYLGLPPESIDVLGVAEAPEWILTIENLASFNRQVRECPTTSGIVVYTGGFPSAAVTKAIERLVRLVNCQIWHWGDVDGGGVLIAHQIDKLLESAGKQLRLHMMSPEIAKTHGKPAKAARFFKEVVPRNPEIAGLADFLARPEAHHLEQEQLDPSLPVG